jgi:hypothetical protein
VGYLAKLVGDSARQVALYLATSRRYAGPADRRFIQVVDNQRRRRRKSVQSSSQKHRERTLFVVSQTFFVDVAPTLGLCAKFLLY